jgi:hypothetical protein
MRNEICGQTCIGKPNSSCNCCCEWADRITRMKWQGPTTAHGPLVWMRMKWYEDACLHTQRLAIACNHTNFGHQSFTPGVTQCAPASYGKAGWVLTILDIRDDVNPVPDFHPQLVQLPPQVLQLVDIRLSQALSGCTTASQCTACRMLLDDGAWSCICYVCHSIKSDVCTCNG